MKRQDSSLHQILEKAKAHEEASRELFRKDKEALDRVNRAIAVWERVDFRGNNIPDELTGDAFWLRKAELIVALAQELKSDGWQERIDAVNAGPEDWKTYAIGILRLALDGDTDSVAKLIHECVHANLRFSLEVDRYLSEDLMYEVLPIRRRLVPPPGWEGSYPQPVEALGDFIGWLEQKIEILDFVGRGKGGSASDGSSIRNAYRLVRKLGLAGVPLAPSGPFSYNEESTALGNLLIALRKAQEAQRPDGASATVTEQGDGGSGEGKSPAKDHRRGRQGKRSSENGGAKVKLIAALVAHHRYAEGTCLNPVPIPSNELARRAGVSKGSAVNFFNEYFGEETDQKKGKKKVKKRGHARYKIACQNQANLNNAIRMLNGDLRPTILVPCGAEVPDPDGPKVPNRPRNHKGRNRYRDEDLE